MSYACTKMDRLYTRLTVIITLTVTAKILAITVWMEGKTKTLHTYAPSDTKLYFPTCIHVNEDRKTSL